ncbi:hypothetical protein ACWEFJ_11160 [Actinosynnema sp. NPDC004786]
MFNRKWPAPASTASTRPPLLRVAYSPTRRFSSAWPMPVIRR